jgi:hypothetical protein
MDELVRGSNVNNNSTTIRGETSLSDLIALGLVT